MGVGSTIASGFGNNANSTSRIHPLLRRHHKTVQTSLTSKRIEFDTVKIRIVERFPHTEKLNCIPVAKPVLDDVSRIVTIFDLCNVCQAEKIISFKIPLHIDLLTHIYNNFTVFPQPYIVSLIVLLSFVIFQFFRSRFSSELAPHP